MLPVSISFLTMSVVFFFNTGYILQDWLEATYFLLAGILAITTVIWARQQALTNQKRTIRLEMRLRYFILTGKPFNPLENKLSTDQLIALRYASDAELLSLLDLTLKEQLGSAQIKRKIKRWKGDFHQV